MSSRTHRGFTLVELLVVVVIIAMLAGLLVPAVISARAAARKTECMNNQKELASAAIQYETAKGHFPGYINPCSGSPPPYAYAGVAPPVNTWVTVLLPHLGRGDLWRDWRTATGPRPQVRLDQLVCPDDDTQQGVSPLSYVANCGLWDGSDPDDRAVNDQMRFGGIDVNNRMVPPDFPRNGVFHNRALPRDDISGPSGPVVEVSASGITDGAPQTLMISETLHPTGRPVVSWWDGNDPTDKSWDFDWYQRAEGRLGFVWMLGNSTNELDAMRITSGAPDDPDGNELRPGNVASNHSGGVVVTFCDAHGQFLKEDIDYRVYQHLMTPNSQEAWTAAGQGYNVSGTLTEGNY